MPKNCHGTLFGCRSFCTAVHYVSRSPLVSRYRVCITVVKGNKRLCPFKSIFVTYLIVKGVGEGHEVEGREEEGGM